MSPSVSPTRVTRRSSRGSSWRSRTPTKACWPNPSSEVLFEEFGDSSLNFTLQVWTKDYSAKPRVLKSELNYTIARIFKENDIEIPFPQRDLHIRSGVLGTAPQ